jgi:hypothetical protein
MRAIDGERRAAVTNRLRERTTRARLSLVRLVILIAFTAACSSYSSVHDEASTMRAEVAACNDGDTCAVVDGINGDCTGLLGCPFPARTDRASEAHARATDIAQRSRGFTQCAETLCAGAASSFSVACDAVAHRCTMAPRP